VLRNALALDGLFENSGSPLRRENRSRSVSSNSLLAEYSFLRSKRLTFQYRGDHMLFLQ